MTVNVLFAGVAVSDLEEALDWYERFLGGPPDMAPHEGERAWQLTSDGWLYVVEDPERAGRGLVTLMVDDLDVRIAGLHRRGIETGDVERLNEKTRRLSVSDPEGNRIQLGEVS